MTRVSLGLVPHRVPRAALASAEIMAGVILAHAWAGGALPPLAWLVAIAALVTALSVPVVSCRAHLGAAVLGVGVAQFGLHALLTAMAPHAGHHAHHAHAAQADAAAWGMTGPMVLAHLASTLLVALVWRVRRRLAEVVLGLPTEPAPLVARVARGPIEADLRRGVEAQWLVGAPRRGPPRSLRCASAP